MTDDKFWSDRHARALAQAREARNLEPFKFATQHAISLKQLKELEAGGCEAFYSERIKFDVGNRLLRKLGVTPEPLAQPQPEPEFEPAPVPAAFAPNVHAPAEEPPQVPVPAPPPAPPVPVRLPGAPSSSWVRALLWAAGTLGLLAAGILIIHPWQRTTDQPASFAPLAAPATSAAAPQASTGVTPAASMPPDAAPLPAPQAVASAEPGTLRQEASSSLCRFTGQGALFTPAQASKAGDYVYLLAQQETRLCLVDATGRETLLTLAAGQSANITGQPPFRLAASQGAQVQVFYQGKRVVWPQEASHVVLNQAPWPPQP